MDYLSRLPDELILSIYEYLDTFSVVALTKTCRRFDRFFRNNKLCRKAIFLPSCGEDIHFEYLMNFFRNNALYITHLDFSYVHWFTRAELVRAVIVLKNLKHINLIGTNLTMSFLINKGNNRRIQSFSFSFVPREGLYLLHNILQVIMVNHFHTPIREMGIDVEGYVTNVVLKAVYMDMAFLLNLYVLPRNVPDISIRLKYSFPYDSHAYVNISQYDGCLVSKFGDADYEDELFIIETLSGVFVSSKLFPEILTVPSLIEIKRLVDLERENIVTIHMYSMSNSQKFDDVMDIAKGIIQERSTKIISLYGPRHCPAEGFKIVEYLSRLKNIKHLSLQPCSLATKVLDDVEEKKTTLFKKARVSKVSNSSQEEDPLGNIAKAHTKIEVLQIKHLDNNHDCCILKMANPEWTLHKSYLDSVSEFKKLRYLTISQVPLLSIDVFSKIFENCTLLETLYVMNKISDITFIESLPKSLHHAKNIRVLELKIIVRNINGFLNLFPECPRLEIINIIFKTDSFAKEKLVTAEAIHLLLNKCPNLTYLGIVEINNQLTMVNKRKLKVMERRLMYMNIRMLVNLSAHKDYMLYSLNDIGEFL